VSIDRTQSQDFVRATAALNAIQQMAMDKDCAVANDVSTCTVFKGEGGTCKTVGALNPGVTGSTLQVGGGGAMIGSLLNVVMIAYAVYQILVLIVQLIWQCEQKEYELAAKKSLKSCTYLGSFCQTKVFGACVEERESYCCYSSHLARILQEQIRPQLGMSYGDIKQPDCRGIPINRLAEVDWDRVTRTSGLRSCKPPTACPRRVMLSKS